MLTIPNMCMSQLPHIDYKSGLPICSPRSLGCALRSSLGCTGDHLPLSSGEPPSQSFYRYPYQVQLTGNLGTGQSVVPRQGLSVSLQEDASGHRYDSTCVSPSNVSNSSLDL